jgi:hypothetical protein
MHLLWQFGAVAFVCSLGGFVVNSVFRSGEVRKRVLLAHGFVVGLFLFLFVNFVYLFYVSRFFSFNWFSFQRNLLSVFAIFFAFKMLRYIKNDRKIIKYYLRIPFSLSKIELLFVIFLVILFLFIAILPLFENDSLEYFAISRYIVADNSLSSYPPLESTWLDSLYAPSTHPPFFHLLFAVFVDTSGNLFFLKLILFVGFLAMISILVGDKNFGYGFLVAISTPLFMFSIQSLNIELFRFSLFASGLALIVSNNIEEFSFRFFLRLFLGFGLILSPHSLGLLMAFLVFVSINLFWKNWKYFSFSLVIFMISFCVVTPQYLLNTLTFGFPIQDSSPIMSLAQIDFERDLRFRRELLSLGDMLVNGAFRSLMDFALFGLVFLLGLILSCMYFVQNGLSRRGDLIVSVSSLVIIFFTIVELISGLLGVDLLIKNVRYATSILPCIIVVIVAKLSERKHA